MPQISVIMAVYKEEPIFVKQAMDSILCQSYADFEFLIYNDNPGDTILDSLIKTYLNKDVRICYERNRDNIGLAATLNKAILKAQGEYLARMDADDISMPQRFEKQIDYLESNKDVIALGTFSRLINTEARIKRNFFLATNYFDVMLYAMYSSPVVHPSVMLRKDFFIENDLFYNENFICAQDYELWSRVLFEKHGKIVNLPLYLFYYRVSSSQISSTNKRQQMYNGLLIRRNNASIFLSNYNLKLPNIVSSKHIKTLSNKRKDFYTNKQSFQMYKTILFMYYMSIPYLKRIFLLVYTKDLIRKYFTFRQTFVLLMSIFYGKKFSKYSLSLLYNDLKNIF